MDVTILYIQSAVLNNQYKRNHPIAVDAKKKTKIVKFCKIDSQSHFHSIVLSPYTQTSMSTQFF